jgi:hypothetical protein
MRRTRYSLRIVNYNLFTFDQNINDVLTWPTYYSVGNVQLTHPGGQAPVERRSAILTARERHSARFNPIRFSKRQVDPAHRRV